MRVALETTEDEMLASIRDSVRAAKAKGREVLLDCEHFFDGYKANPAYALASAKAAYDEGARWVVLCDTNGGTLPHEVEKIVGEVCKLFPATTSASTPITNRAGGGEFVCRGARRRASDPGHAQRARRALRQRQSGLDHSDAEAEAGIFAEIRHRRAGREAANPLTRLAYARRDAQPRARPHAPYVGESAFATKAGIHASAIMKEPATYEHVAPEIVGNRRKLLVSDQSGRANLLAELERIGLSVDKDDPRVIRLLDEVKDREAIGYAYEAADASFGLLARRMLGKVRISSRSKLRRQCRAARQCQGRALTSARPWSR